MILDHSDRDVMRARADHRLKLDLLTAPRTLGVKEARYLVDAYFAIQEFRQAGRSRMNAISRTSPPHAVITWLHRRTRSLRRRSSTERVDRLDTNLALGKKGRHWPNPLSGPHGED